MLCMYCMYLVGRYIEHRHDDIIYLQKQEFTLA